MVFKGFQGCSTGCPRRFQDRFRNVPGVPREFNRLSIGLEGFKDGAEYQKFRGVPGDSVDPRGVLGPWS